MYQFIYSYFCLILILLLFFVLFSLMIISIASLIYRYSIKDGKKEVLKVRENGPYYILLYDSVVQSFYETIITLKMITLDLSLNYYKYRYIYVIFVILSCFSLVMLYEQQPLLVAVDKVYGLLRISVGDVILKLLNLVRIIYDLFIPFYNFVISLTRFFYNYLLGILDVKIIFMEMVQVIENFSLFIYEIVTSIVNYMESPITNHVNLYTPLTYLFKIPRSFNSTINQICYALTLPYEIISESITQPMLPSFVNNTFNGVVYVALRMVPFAIQNNMRPSMLPFFECLIKSIVDLSNFLDHIILNTIQDIINIIDAPLHVSDDIMMLRKFVVWKKINFPCIVCIVGNATNVVTTFTNVTVNLLLNVDKVIDAVIFNDIQKQLRIESSISIARSYLDYNSTFEQINETLNSNTQFLRYLLNSTNMNGFSVVPSDVMRIPVQIIRLTYMTSLEFLLNFISNPFQNMRNIFGMGRAVDELWNELFIANDNFLRAVMDTVKNAKNSIKYLVSNTFSIFHAIINMFICIARLSVDVFVNSDKIITELATKTPGNYLLSPKSSFVIYLNESFVSITGVGDSIGEFFYYTNSMKCVDTFDYICDLNVVSLECSIGNAIKSFVNLFVAISSELEKVVVSIYSLSFCGVLPDWEKVLRPVAVDFMERVTDILCNIFNFAPLPKCGSGCIAAKMSKALSSYIFIFTINIVDVVYDAIKVVVYIVVPSCQKTEKKTISEMIVHTIILTLNSVAKCLQNLLSLLKCFFAGDSSLEGFLDILLTASEKFLNDFTSIIVNIVNIILGIFSGNGKVIYNNFLELVKNIGSNLFKFVGGFLGNYFFRVIGEWVDNPACKLCGSFFGIFDLIYKAVKYATLGLWRLDDFVPCCYLCKCPTPGICRFGQIGCVTITEKKSHIPKNINNQSFVSVNDITITKLKNPLFGVILESKNKITSTRDIQKTLMYNSNNAMTSNYNNDNSVNGGDVLETIMVYKSNQYLEDKFRYLNQIRDIKRNNNLDDSEFVNLLFENNNNITQVVSNCIDFYIYLFGKSNSSHSYIEDTQLNQCTHINVTFSLNSNMNDVCELQYNSYWSLYKYFLINKDCIRKRLLYQTLKATPLFSIYQYIKQISSITILDLENMIRVSILLQIKNKIISDETSNQLCNTKTTISHNNFMQTTNSALELYYNDYENIINQSSPDCYNAIKDNNCFKLIVTKSNESEANIIYMARDDFIDSTTHHFSPLYFEICHRISIEKNILSTLYTVHDTYDKILSVNLSEIFWNTLNNIKNELFDSITNNGEDDYALLFHSLYQSSINVVTNIVDVFNYTLQHNVVSKIQKKIKVTKIFMNDIGGGGGGDATNYNKFTITKSKSHAFMALNEIDSNKLLINKNSIQISNENSFLDKCAILSSYINYIKSEWIIIREYYQICIPISISNFRSSFVNTSTMNYPNIKCVMNLKYFEYFNADAKLCLDKENGCYNDSFVVTTNHDNSKIIGLLKSRVFDPLLKIVKKDYYSKYVMNAESEKNFFELYLKSFFKCNIKTSLYCQTHSLGFVLGLLTTIIFYFIIIIINKYFIVIPLMNLFIAISFVPLFNYFSYAISPFCVPQLSSCLFDDIYWFVSNYILPVDIPWGCIKNQGRIQKCQQESFLLYPIQVILYILYWIRPSIIKYLSETRLPLVYEIMNVASVKSIITKLLSDNFSFTCLEKYCIVLQSSVYFIFLTLIVISVPIIMIIMRYLSVLLLFSINIIYCLYKIDKRLLLDIVYFFMKKKKKKRLKLFNQY